MGWSYHLEEVQMLWIEDPRDPPKPEPATSPVGPADPVAAALGNACLLGVGYLLLRRWKAAAAAAAVTTVLILILANQPSWIWRAVLLLWGAATVVHAWHLAGGRLPFRTPSTPVATDRRPSRRQRIVAATAVATVWLAGLGVAIDARRVEAAAVTAHRAGDCADALERVDRIAAWHRVVDPRVSVRADQNVAACQLLFEAQELAERQPVRAAATLRDYLDHPAGLWEGAADLRIDLLLRSAGQELDQGMNGAPGPLPSAFDTLQLTVAEAPHRAADARAVLADYLGRLSAAPACHAASNVGWLHERGPTGTVLDEELAALAEIAPPILIECGDELLDSDPTGASDTYRMLLDHYPDHPLADRARQGLVDAELPEVRRLLAGWPDPIRADDVPYCDRPAGYGGAPPHQGRGPHRVVDTGLPVALPAGWEATDFTDAVLVLCAELSHGSTIGECDYYVENWTRYPDLTSPQLTSTLVAREYRIVAYELRTGQVVAEETVETGSGCPPFPSSFRSFLAIELAWNTDPEPILAAIEPWVHP